MNTANIQKIHSGITDGNTEFFAHENEFKAFHKGEIIDFKNFPLEILNFIRKLYRKDFKAQKALTAWGITGNKERLKRYGMCMFGGLDNVPDLMSDGTYQSSEYWDCGRRGNCPFEGKICKPVEVKNGILTIKEIEVIQMLSLGDKEAVSAEKLGMAFNTLTNHKTAINNKMGTQSKFQSMMEAMKRNIINYVW